MSAIIAPMDVGRQRPLTAVVRYEAGHSPKSPSAIASTDATTQLQSPLVPDGGGWRLLLRIDTRHRRSRFLTRTATNEKRPRSPALYITRQSTSQKRRWGITVSSSVNGAAEQRAADATRKARGGTYGNNEHNNQPIGPCNNTRIRAEGRGGVAGGVGEKGEKEG